MKRAILLILFLLVIVAVPTISNARILVTISVLNADGTVYQTKGPSNPPPGFTLSMSAPAGANHTLNILSSSPRFFPSGCNPLVAGDCDSATTGDAGDTFKMENVNSSTDKWRVEKIDVPAGGTATTGADTLALRGFKTTALAAAAGKKLQIIYETEAGDFTQITSSTGNYSAAVKLLGQDRNDTVAPIDGNSGPISTMCNNGVSDPCLQLKLEVNLITLNAAGSNASANITASAPCSIDSLSPDYKISPCGTSGKWNPTLGIGDQFLITDSGSVGCGTTCNPVQKGTFTAKVNQNDVVQLKNSAATGLAADTQDGWISLLQQLAEPGIDSWVASCSGVQRYQVVWQSPLGNKRTRNQTDGATIPLKGFLEAADLEPATGGFTLESVVDPVAELVLSHADRERNNACFMSWIPSSTTRPALKDLGPFTLKWTDFVVGEAASTYPVLGNLTYSDCTDCYRVEIELLKDGISAGKLKIYTGSDANTHYKTNHEGTASPLDFFANSDSRVDPSGLDFALLNKPPETCCTSLADAASNGKYGKLPVRAVTVVVDQGEGTTGLTTNYQVKSVEAVVNGSSSSSQLLVATGYQPSCDWPPNLVMQIYKVQTDETRTWARTVVDTAISNCQLQGSVKVADFAPGASGSGNYEVLLSAFSGASDPNQEFIGGITIPFPGEFALK